MKIMLSHGQGIAQLLRRVPHITWHRTPITLTSFHSSLAGQAVYPAGMTSRNPTHPAGIRGHSCLLQRGSSRSACASCRRRQHLQAWPVSLAAPGDKLCHLTQQAGRGPSPGSKGAQRDDEDRREDAEEACVPNAWGMCQRKLQQHGWLKCSWQDKDRQRAARPRAAQQ